MILLVCLLFAYMIERGLLRGRQEAGRQMAAGYARINERAARGAQSTAGGRYAATAWRGAVHAAAAGAYVARRAAPVLREAWRGMRHEAPRMARQAYQAHQDFHDRPGTPLAAWRFFNPAEDQPARSRPTPEADPYADAEVVDAELVEDDQPAATEPEPTPAAYSAPAAITGGATSMSAYEIAKATAGQAIDQASGLSTTLGSLAQALAVAKLPDRLRASNREALEAIAIIDGQLRQIMTEMVNVHDAVADAVAGVETGSTEGMGGATGS